MNVLFVCTHNACRSILAEAITRALAGPRIRVASAGSDPAGRVHPLTIEFLQAAGYPIGGLHSKGLSELGDFEPDVVITVCDSAASEACPVWLAGDAIRIHWSLPDPSHLRGSDAERRAMFGTVAATLSNRISALLERPFETLDEPDLARLFDDLASHQA